MALKLDSLWFVRRTYRIQRALLLLGIPAYYVLGSVLAPQPGYRDPEILRILGSCLFALTLLLSKLPPVKLRMNAVMTTISFLAGIHALYVLHLNDLSTHAFFNLYFLLMVLAVSFPYSFSSKGLLALFLFLINVTAGYLAAVKYSPGEILWYELVVLMILSAVCYMALHFRYKALELAHTSERRFRALLSASPDLLFLMDKEGRYLDLYVQNQDQLFLPVPDCLGKKNSEFLPADIARREVEAIEKTLQTGEPCRYEYELHWKGEIQSYEAITAATGENQVLVAARDITDRKQAEKALIERAEQLRKYEFIVNTSLEYMTLIDRNYRYEAVNQAYCNAHKKNREDIIGHTVADIWGDQLFEARLRGLLDRAFAGEIVQYDLPIAFSDGQLKHFEIAYYPYRTGEVVSHVVVVSRDQTSEKVAEQLREYEARHDSLTKLGNRKQFREALQSSLNRLRRDPNYCFSTMVINLDHFKIVNDSLGHETGDKLLIAVADRLRTLIRSIDYLARSAGGEFLLLMDCVVDQSQVERYAERILLELRHPYFIDGVEIYATASIGICLADREEHTSSGDCLREADAALFEAKKLGRDRFDFFSRRLYEAAVHHIQLGSELRLAMERDELEVFYMPIYSPGRQKVTGYEALIRWNHPERGLLPPAYFIEFAEETGLIVKLGEIVLRKACRQMRQWQKEGMDGFLAVNISARQFRQRGFVDMIHEILQQSDLSANTLELEITESSFLERSDAALTLLESLSGSGIRLSIDDFGTGYSSLSYLKHFPFHTLKIDRSFLFGSDRGQNREIIRSIIELAHALELKVVAEGIETQEQMQLLLSLGCDEMQGYFIGHPLPASEIGRKLALP
ncbi:MAG: EAL domain-containing protein [Spirochaetales bacterium]|nr:EAL domain-containing protein [Spirochaetales bacterium]